uniref:Uncharacterized protein n=1 Tax=Lepeophtheirus salmonis TaxID=72036 RepID=A0A0K2TWT9_LEPSM
MSCGQGFPTSGLLHNCVKRQFTKINIYDFLSRHINNNMPT